MHTRIGTKREVAQSLVYSSPLFKNTHKPDKHSQKQACKYKLEWLTFAYNKQAINWWKWGIPISLFFFFCFVFDRPISLFVTYKSAVQRNDPIILSPNNNWCIYFPTLWNHFYLKWEKNKSPLKFDEVTTDYFQHLKNRWSH